MTGIQQLRQYYPETLTLPSCITISLSSVMHLSIKLSALFSTGLKWNVIILLLCQLKYIIF